MAGIIKTKKKEDVVEKKSTNKATSKFSNSNLEAILLTPRITEKATDLQMEHNTYTFNVSMRSNKTMIAQAIEMIYGVTPIDIKIVNVPDKIVMSRKGKKGVKSGGKKAYIRLKKGDTIEFV